MADTQNNEKDDFEYIKQQVIAMLQTYSHKGFNDVFNSEPGEEIADPYANVNFTQVISDVESARDTNALKLAIGSSGLPEGEQGTLNILAENRGGYIDGWGEPLEGMPAGFVPGDGKTGVISVSDGSGRLDPSTEAMLRSAENPDPVVAQAADSATSLLFSADDLFQTTPNTTKTNPHVTGGGVISEGEANDIAHWEKAATLASTKPDPKVTGGGIISEGEANDIAHWATAPPQASNQNPKVTGGGLVSEGEANDIAHWAAVSASANNPNPHVTGGGVISEGEANDIAHWKKEEEVAWAGVPEGIAKGEQADMFAQQQQEAAFYNKVEGMTPEERQNLTNFFENMKKDPEGTKAFIAGVEAKETHVANIEQQIVENNKSETWTGVSNNIASAEQAEMDRQLNAERAAAIAAPINPDFDPALISDLNPEGSKQKQADLDAFFAGVKKAEEEKAAAASAIDVRISQINSYDVPQKAKDAAINEVKKGNTSSVSDLIKFFNGGSTSGGPSASPATNNSSLVTIPPNPNKVQQVRALPGKAVYQ